MRLLFNILFLGWWFAGQSRTSDTHALPKPSISVSPSHVVVLGGNVSIHCKSEQYRQMEFYLVKEKPHVVINAKTTESHEAIFPILNAKIEDAGIYSCQYHPPAERHRWSDYSDHICINITDSTLTKPSIKLQREPAVGKTVTFECQGPERGLIFSLHKSTNLTAMQTEESAGYTAHFSFHMLRLEDAGNYTCQYHHRQKPFVWSGPSDSVKLILIDPNLMKPTTILQGEPTLGKNVTIECQGPEPGLIFSLCKSRNLTSVQIVQPEGDKASFPFYMLSLKDAGKYTCQYHCEEKPFIWSEPSDPVELILQDWTTIWTICGSSLLLLLLLVLLAFLFYRRRKRGSAAEKRTQPLSEEAINTIPEAEAGEDPDGVSYAVLNHQPSRTKQIANPDTAFESCLYASVAKDRARKGQ